MKRVALAIVSTVASLVMLLSFKTHTQAAPTTPPAAIGTTGTTGATGAEGGTAGNTPSTKSSASGAVRTYTGGAVGTRFGPVQVRITVRNGNVSSATAVEYPTSNPRDAQINAYAIPRLNTEAASASSASIDMVSGATYTSQGYISSLQSALDAAGL
jgi:uncharacterized protein with FMN-binding domain